MQAYFLLILLLAIGVSGCASTPQASLDRDAEAKQFGSSPAAAAVYIYRPDAASGEGDAVLWVDDRLIGATLPRAYFRVQLDPGRHVLNGLAADNGRLALETRPGEVYFIEQALTSGQSRFRLVSSDTGRQAIANCCHLLENWSPGQRPLLR